MSLPLRQYARQPEPRPPQSAIVATARPFRRGSGIAAKRIVPARARRASTSLIAGGSLQNSNEFPTAITSSQQLQKLGVYICTCYL
jgi:hypothetical protein